LKFAVTKKQQHTDNSASAVGGPPSRVCARETLRSAPHRHWRKFVGAHVGGGGGIKLSESFLINFLAKSENYECTKMSKYFSDQFVRQIRQF
jgi:hypothetical protein